MNSKNISEEDKERLKIKKKAFITESLPFTIKERNYEMARADIAKARYDQFRYTYELNKLLDSQKEQKEEKKGNPK